MPENTGTKSDERFAFGLLMDHLTGRGETDFQCEINTNDPPELIVTWMQGERWGVEVTRAYQQVDQIGTAETVSSEDVGAFLRTFATKLAEETDDKRHRDYLLSGGAGSVQLMETVRFQETVEKGNQNMDHEPYCLGREWIPRVSRRCPHTR